MTFHVGQKVVCVTDNWLPGSLTLAMPAANRVYTVRDIVLRPWSDVKSGLHLIEVANAASIFNDGAYEPYFDAQYFRPVVERKSEISFTANAPKDSEKWDNRKRVKVRA